MNPLFDDNLVTKKFCEYLNEQLSEDLKFTSHTPITGKGFQNIVHILKNNCDAPVAVLRIFSLPATAKNEYLTLSAMQERTSGTGIVTCPKILFVEQDNSHIPFPFMIQEFVAGDTLTRGDIHNDAFITDAANLLREIHSVNGPPQTAEQIERDAEFWPKWAVGLIAAVPQSQVLYMQVQETLATHLAGLKSEWAALPRTTLNHGDPNVGNFIRTRTGELRLLDWEMSGSNHRLLDIAAFITSNELTAAEEALFLETYYKEERESIQKEAALLWLFKVRRLFALIAYFVMLLRQTPAVPATEEKRIMLQGTLESFAVMFEQCVNQQLEVEIHE